MEEIGNLKEAKTAFWVAAERCRETQREDRILSGS